MSFNVGESLVGEGNEVAHIDLLIGDKTVPSEPHSPMHLPTRKLVTATCSPCWNRIWPSNLPL